MKTGQVTYAVRDTSIDGVEIRKDDLWRLLEVKLLLSTPKKMDADEKLLASLVDEDS